MELGKHDFAGACSPETLGEKLSSRQKTFSVGIFQWISTKSGQGVRRSPVKVRVRGLVTESDTVWRMAKKIAEELDAGIYKGPKIVCA